MEGRRAVLLPTAAAPAPRFFFAVGGGRRADAGFRAAAAESFLF